MKNPNYKDFFYIAIDDFDGYKFIMYSLNAGYTYYVLFDEYNYPLKIKCGTIYVNQLKGILDLYELPSNDKLNHSNQN